MTRARTRVIIDAPDDVEGFWRMASALDAKGVKPEEVTFEMAGDTPDLFGGQPLPDRDASAARPTIPGDLRALLDLALLHKEPERFALAYRLLRRLRKAPHLLAIASDRDVAWARDLAKSVRRDKHKMTAFVRFRETQSADGEPVYVAWFEPDHHIVAATAPFFVRRFANMRWSILTPRRSAHWDGERLTIGEGASVGDRPEADPLEEVWRTYYAHIFNPSRLMVDAMRAQMPKKYWHNLPEAPLIAPLIATAQERSRSMVAAPATVARRPSSRKPDGGCTPTPPFLEKAAVASMDELLAKGARCKGCALQQHATQAVPGEGPPDARLMFVGEQPGDEEDIAGRPFIGPAGRLFDIALRRSGIDRSACFVTNAVKHFKFEARGKRRLHRNPNAGEIERCRWWLRAERALVKPELIVALGGSAARSLLGTAVKIKDVRGQVIPLDGHEKLLVTVHPSFLLRLQEQEAKRREWHAFLADLKLAQRSLTEGTLPPP
jgi:probable DNA metabolism protein